VQTFKNYDLCVTWGKGEGGGRWNNALGGSKPKATI